MRAVIVAFLLVGCGVDRQNIPKPAEDDGKPKTYVSHPEITQQPILNYCAVEEYGIRDCNKFGDQSGNPEIGWVLDSPQTNEVQIAGYGPQGFQCKIINCNIWQPYDQTYAGALIRLSRFRLDWGIDRQRNGYNAYSELYGQDCWGGSVWHQQWGRYQYSWGWNHAFKSFVCYPNRSNANPTNW